MAKNDNLNLSRETGADTEKPDSKGRLIAIVTLVLVLVLLLLAAGAGAYYFLLARGDRSVEGSEPPVARAPREPIYADVNKVLATFQYGGRTRYVQADVQLMSYSPRVIEQVRRDMPAIRDRLLFLISAQDFAVLKTLEGKEALRADALQAVNTILGLAPPDVVEALYFEDFILQ